MSDCDAHGTLTAGRSSQVDPHPRTPSSGSHPTPGSCRCGRRRTASPAGGRPQRSQRPQRHADRRVAAQSGPRDRARGQHRRADHQYQRGRLLQDHPAHQRERRRRRDQLRRQRQGRGHRRLPRAIPGGDRGKPPQMGHTRGPARLAEGADHRLAGLVLTARPDRRQHRTQRPAQRVLHAGPVGRRRRAG